MLRLDGVGCASAHSTLVSPISKEERLGSRVHFNKPGSGQHSIWCGGPARKLAQLGQENMSKPMNETGTAFHHPKPPRPVQILVNAIATTILRSPWHGMRSQRLLLITFTGRKSGKEFTTLMRYVQEGETLRLLVVRSPWWKNLREQATVRILLRGQMRTGTAEVLPEEDGVVVVKIHLKG